MVLVWAGSTCALAMDFSDFSGGMVRGSTADSRHSLQSQCGSDAAPDVVYKYLLPPGETITIRRSANDYAMTGELRMDNDCPGYALVACLGYGIDSQSEISYTNTDSFSVDMYYIQSGESEDSMGQYELQVDVGQAAGGEMVHVFSFRCVPDEQFDSPCSWTELFHAFSHFDLRSKTK